MHSFFGRNNLKDELFVIADLGLTCGGDIERTKRLVKIASDLGVDAVKLQMLSADELLGDKQVTYTYPTLKNGNITENMFEMFSKLEFNDDEWAEIKSTCDDCGVSLIVTAHVESAVERVNKLNLAVNKICTWSLSHYRMIKMLAQNSKPLIIDTGTIFLEELKDLERFYKENGGGEIIVLYDFHTADLTQIDMDAIRSLKLEGYIVGYTPQGRSDWLDYMAIGCGATVIEKRLTIDRSLPENGNWKAHDPIEFSDWLKNIRECWVARGSGSLHPTIDDLMDSKKYYKSAWLVKDVKQGDIICEDDFEFKRPGLGISSKDIILNYIGKPYHKNFSKGQLFTRLNMDK